MNEQAIKNLKTVRKEAIEIMDNIEGVRGPRYRALVNGLILTTKLVETVAFIERADGPGAVRTLREVFLHVLHDQVREFLSLTSVSEEELYEAMADADRVSGSVEGLIKSAIDAAISGEKWGES